MEYIAHIDKENSDSKKNIWRGTARFQEILQKIRKRGLGILLWDAT